MSGESAAPGGTPGDPGRSLNVVYATDRRGLVGLAASALSLAQHVPPTRPLSFWILDQGLTWKERSLVAADLRGPRPAVTVSFVPLSPDWFSGFIHSRSIPRVAYARLLLGDLLPDSVARCLYLDVDTVCLGNVEDLHDLDLGGLPAAAVPNASSGGDGRVEFQRLGVEGSGYFNSGVLVCDLARWREERIGEAAIAFVRQAGSRLIMHDQDALNVVLRGRWKSLPDSWNRWAVHTASGETRILHYTMSPKPWHADYRGPERDRYVALLKQTSLAHRLPRNPLGLTALGRRVRARLPYLPTVLRMLRERVNRWFTPPGRSDR